MKLRIVTPITTHGFADVDAFRTLVRPDTELSRAEIDHGPALIEWAFDWALVDMGLRHSKRTHAFPPARRIIGYDVAPRTREALVGD
jgi:hypothetical protein